MRRWGTSEPTIVWERTRWGRRSLPSIPLPGAALSIDARLDTLLLFRALLVGLFAPIRSDLRVRDSLECELLLLSIVLLLSFPLPISEMSIDALLDGPLELRVLLGGLLSPFRSDFRVVLDLECVLPDAIYATMSSSISPKSALSIDALLAGLRFRVLEEGLLDSLLALKERLPNSLQCFAECLLALSEFAGITCRDGRPLRLRAR